MNLKKIILGIYIFAIYIACLWPGDKLPQVSVNHFDKIVHFSMYFILGILLHQILEQKKRILFLVAILIGISIELLQTQVPFRSFELMDILANTIGAGVGILFSFLIRPKIFLCFLILLSSCARSPLKNIEESMRPAKTNPELKDDLGDNFLNVLEKHIVVMEKSEKVLDPMIFGKIRIPKNSYISSLKEILLHKNDWQDYIKNNFVFYEVYGKDHWGEVLTTGYYAPTVFGSKVKTENFTQALFALPSEKTDFDRKAIDEDKVLENKKLELVWVDPIDAFFIHIQGSGIIILPDGDRIRLGYAGQNCSKYVPIGKFLNDVIPLKEMSMQKIRAYLQTLNKEQQQIIFNYNPSYIFFKIIDSDALTYSGMEVVAGRTIATDNRFFPKGAIGFLDIETPIFDNLTSITPSFWINKPRIVFDQDTGGAIKGGGHVDLYFGNDNNAAQLAGVMKQIGHLYYLVPKNYSSPPK
jgi:membrane-bound lytic murein transglycosylase A